jgi:hypothetical protein
MDILMRAVTSPTLLEDPSQLDALFATEGWQTLLTFAREVAREYILRHSFLFPDPSKQPVRQRLRQRLRTGWTKISHKKYSIRSQQTKLPVQLAEAATVMLQRNPAVLQADGYAHIVPLKTRMAAGIVKSVDCRLVSPPCRI